MQVLYLTLSDKGDILIPEKNITFKGWSLRVDLGEILGKGNQMMKLEREGWKSQW